MMGSYATTALLALLLASMASSSNNRSQCRSEVMASPNESPDSLVNNHDKAPPATTVPTAAIEVSTCEPKVDKSDPWPWVVVLALVIFALLVILYLAATVALAIVAIKAITSEDED